MEEENITRKLAAILYADVADYSRLTGEDEAGTHKRLSAYLDTISAAIEAHGGKVVHYAGDAVLAEFPSVVGALTCAVEAQRELGERNADLPNDKRRQFRIGLNLGEVIVDRGDIYGDPNPVSVRVRNPSDLAAYVNV